MSPSLDSGYEDLRLYRDQLDAPPKENVGEASLTTEKLLELYPDLNSGVSVATARRPLLISPPSDSGSQKTITLVKRRKVETVNIFFSPSATGIDVVFILRPRNLQGGGLKLHHARPLSRHAAGKFILSELSTKLQGLVTN